MKLGRLRSGLLICATRIQVWWLEREIARRDARLDRAAQALMRRRCHLADVRNTLRLQAAAARKGQARLDPPGLRLIKS